MSAAPSPYSSKQVKASASFTYREVTLILYKAAELQEGTWWLRSARLAMRSQDRSIDAYSLADIEKLAVEMSIEPKHIRQAAAEISRGVQFWDAT